MTKLKIALMIPVVVAAWAFVLGSLLWAVVLVSGVLSLFISGMYFLWFRSLG